MELKEKSNQLKTQTKAKNESKKESVTIFWMCDVNRIQLLVINCQFVSILNFLFEKK